MTAYAYPARITRAREGGWIIHFRDFPEGHSQAEDGEDVIDIAERVLKALGKELRISVVDAPKPPQVRERMAKYRVARKPLRKSATRASGPGA